MTIMKVVVFTVLALLVSIVSGKFECRVTGCGETGSACPEDESDCKHSMCINETCKYTVEGEDCSDNEYICDYNDPDEVQLYCNEKTRKCTVRPKFGEICGYESGCQDEDDTVYCNATSSKPGVCKKYGVAGDFCDYKNECDDDKFYCTDYDGGVCKRYPTLGEECTSNNCVNEDGDEDDIFCNMKSEDKGVCSQTLKVGEACYYDTSRYKKGCEYTLYCTATSDNKAGICKSYPKENEECTYDYDCRNDDGSYSSDFFCNKKDGAEKGVCKKSLKAGEACYYSTSKTNNGCETDTLCNATYYDKAGICVKLPTLDEKCLIRGNYYRYYYCASGSAPEVNESDASDCTCVDVPQEGESCSYKSSCTNATDGNFLYCKDPDDNDEYAFTGICSRLPAKGEECYSGETSAGHVYGKCRDNLKCGVNRICMEPVSKENEYCEEDYSEDDDYYVKCADGLICLDNNCTRIKKDGEKCEYNSECDYPSSTCVLGKCTKWMSIGEGGECKGRNYYSRTSISMYDIYRASVVALQCKEGLACVPHISNDTKFVCAKPSIKLSDKRSCNKLCPIDSFCDCNTEDGFQQCVPYPTSQKWALEYYMNILNDDDYEDSYMALMRGLYDEFFPYKEDFRCGHFDPSGDASSQLIVSGFVVLLVSLLNLF